MRRTTRPATKKAIEKINRRADTLARIYGKHSIEYENFTTRMAELVNSADDIFTTKNGFLHIRNTNSARENYRQITAFAKSATKTPVSVLKRKKKSDDDFFYDSNEDTQDNRQFINKEVYDSWVKQFIDYWYSCYDLAGMEGYTGEAKQDRADELQSDDDLYAEVWNAFYKKGAFSAYETKVNEYNQQETQQEYDIDEVGNMTEKDAFQRDYSQQGVDIDYGY